MHVLLTGATGFVGGRVAAGLRGRGDAVRALVRQPSPALADIGVEQREADLAEPDGLADHLDGVDAVVHAAAALGQDLETSRRVNRDGTAALVDGLATGAGPTRLVHVSTTAVYDRAAVGDEELSEDGPLVIDDGPYAVTKAEAEAEVARGATCGLSTLVLRPPAVLGAGERSVWGERVPRALREGTYPARDPAATFAWVHVEDLVAAVLLGLDADVEATVNVVGGHATVGAYVARAADAVGVAPPEPGDAEPGWRGRFAAERMRSVLGLHRVHDFDEAMDEIAAWWSG